MLASVGWNSSPSIEEHIVGTACVFAKKIVLDMPSVMPPTVFTTSLTNTPS